MSEATLTTLTYLVPVGPLAAFVLILLVSRKSHHAQLDYCLAGCVRRIGFELGRRVLHFWSIPD